MGDLQVDTTISGSNGHYTGEMSPEWAIWGPMGGYAASFALRAAAAEASADFVPISMTAQFFQPADFSTVDIAVETRRATRGTSGHSVRLTQSGTAILDAQVWFAASRQVVEHDHAVHHGYGPPDDYPSVSELTDDDAPFAFWTNFDGRPCDWVENWETYTAGEPRWAEWMRFLPTSAFDDPVMEACRLLILADLPSYPAATRAHDGAAEPWVAPNVDVAVQFHRLDELGEWMLSYGLAPVARNGLIGFRSEVWTADNRLVASGAGQLLARRVPAR